MKGKALRKHNLNEKIDFDLATIVEYIRLN